MLGGLLAELPWFLDGNTEAAKTHLVRAIALDANYTNARILLAKLLIEQLLAIIHSQHPHYPYAWAHRFLPEAQSLLRFLEKE